MHAFFLLIAIVASVYSKTSRQLNVNKSYLQCIYFQMRRMTMPVHEWSSSTLNKYINYSSCFLTNIDQNS